MKKIAILTSGGDAPGMNACVRACVRYAIYNGFEVYGVERGYVGLINDKLFLMNKRSVSDIIHRGGTILKTARCLEFKDIEYQKKAANILRSHGIENLIVIGGDGSFRGARDLSVNCGINVVCIPATIDNDLAYTDYTLGFDTAVNTVLSAINNLRDTMTSHDRVSLVEVMGRKCGDLALYATIGGGVEHCLVPEIPVDVKAICDAIKKSQSEGKTSNMIIMAEGVENKEQIIATIQQETGISIKITHLGHTQRGGSPSMADRLLAAKFGVRAVDLLINGQTNRTVGIVNNQIIDKDIIEAVSMKKQIDTKLHNIAQIISL